MKHTKKHSECQPPPLEFCRKSYAYFEPKITSVGLPNSVKIS